jgi:hypothetical protein
VELQAELRSTSDRLLHVLDQLEELENQKRLLKPSDPRFDTLAREIERLASEIFAQTHAQQKLGERAQARAESSGTELAPIEATPPRDLRVILTEWRDAERRLQLAAPDSAEHALATADSERLRDEYHSAYSAGAATSQDD